MEVVVAAGMLAKNEAFVKSQVENGAIRISYDSRMELRQLELLASVIDSGSLTAAAKHCNLSQPAISQ